MIAILTVLLLSFELFLGRSIGRFDFVPKAIISNATDTPIIPQLNQVGKVLAEKFGIYSRFIIRPSMNSTAPKIRRFFKNRKLFCFQLCFLEWNIFGVVFKKVNIRRVSVNLNISVLPVQAYMTSFDDTALSIMPFDIRLAEVE